MGWLQQLAERLAAMKFWFMVRPWEKAIRVRCGRSVVTAGPGLHFRLPFVDEVFIQNTRRRVLNLPVQTVTTKGGQTVTLSGVVHWSIADVALMYQKLHVPDDWIINTVLAAIAETICAAAGEISPQQVGKAATDALRQRADGHLGLSIDEVSVTDLARVKTFRLITGEGNSGYSWNRVGTLETATR